jgi:hypothetical protein
MLSIQGHAPSDLHSSRKALPPSSATLGSKPRIDEQNVKGGLRMCSWLVGAEWSEAGE